MTEWLITIESPAGVLASADDLERVALEVDRDRRALGPALGLTSTTGAVSATFTVVAETVGGAATVAVDIMRSALGGAGFDRLGWRIELEQDDAEPAEPEPVLA